MRRSGPASAFQAREYGLEVGDLWRTNPNDYAPAAAEWGFTLDVSATAESSLAGRWIDPELDALDPAVDWLEHAGPPLPGYRWPAAFLNPPYSRKGGGLLRWVERALEHAARGLLVVMLIPPSMATAYMRAMHRAGDEIRLWPTRRAFLDPDTGAPVKANRGDSCLAVAHPGRFLEGELRSPEARARVMYIGDDRSGVWASACRLEWTAKDLRKRGEPFRGDLEALGAELRRRGWETGADRFNGHVIHLRALHGGIRGALVGAARDPGDVGGLPLGEGTFLERYREGWDLAQGWDLQAPRAELEALVREELGRRYAELPRPTWAA